MTIKRNGPSFGELEYRYFYPDRSLIKDEIIDLLKNVRVYERLAIEAGLGQDEDLARKALESHPLIGKSEAAGKILAHIRRRWSMKGSIILNGNIKFETDYVNNFKNKILSSVHKDPEVRKNKKSLLITAAWQQNEYNEHHVKDALRNIGIPSIPDRHGYDVNIQNLAVYHEFNKFKKAETRAL